MKIGFWLLVIALWGIAESVRAQDVIFRKNGEVLKVTILTNTGKSRSYQLPGDEEGVVRHISINAIDSILYENGTRDVFNQTPPDLSLPVPEEIRSFNRKYLAGDAGALLFYQNLQVSYEYLPGRGYFGIFGTISKNLKPVGEMISQADGVAYPFNGVATTEATLDGVILQFPLPENPSEGKLIIRAKNSLWLEHVFSEFHLLFGGMYNTFSRREAKRPAEEMRELMFNQGFPLAVYLEKNGDWELIDFYEVAGPMAFRDDVLSINLSEAEGENVRIKLETGFMFWELDYAAMDFSRNIPLLATTVSALEAIDETGKDVSAAIRSDDGAYYVQPEIGNEAAVTFPVPEFTAETRTVFLESKGFYKILRDQKGSAEWKTLRTFRDPGRMPEFSKELFDRFMAMSGE